MVTLREIAEDLFAAVGPSRVTVRGAVPARSAGTSPEPETTEPDTTELLVELVADGVPSMAGTPRDEIPNAPTYLWLREHRRPLIQPDTSRDPLPPRMLTQAFGVGAQLLGPLFRGEELIGTISVHQMGGPREWSETEIQALTAAVARVRGLWELDDSDHQK
jgi:GAF domain-containing protein